MRPLRGSGPGGATRGPSGLTPFKTNWNNSTIVRGDVVAEVSKLKQQEGGSLLIWGHGLLAETLLKHQMLDVLDLSIHPVVAGHGKLFFREGDNANLKRVATKSFSKIVKLTYEPQYGMPR
jgi:dihydrofolate reductase